jgi:uncharacterized membrane protein YphA (DoxX/SURF4 family)
MSLANGLDEKAVVGIARFNGRAGLASGEHVLTGIQLKSARFRIRVACVAARGKYRPNVQLEIFSWVVSRAGGLRGEGETGSRKKRNSVLFQCLSILSDSGYTGRYMSEFAARKRPGWQIALNWTAAILMAAVFLIAGIWKATDPARVAVMLTQLKVPQSLSLGLSVCLAIGETFTGILLLVPRFRKWGSAAGTILLTAFLIYIGIHYAALRGADCSCFPWLKRTVGPGFFFGDAIMLLLAVVAGVTAPAAASLRATVLILAGVTAFALGSYGIASTRHTGVKAPASITAEDGKKISLTEGKVFIYFFNPQCMHCLDAGRKLAALNWGDTRFIGVPTENPQFGGWFMGKAHLTGKGPVSDNVDLLKKVFPFDLPPAGVALEDGYEKAMLLQFEDAEPRATLAKLGFVK